MSNLDIFDKDVLKILLSDADVNLLKNFTVYHTKNPHVFAEFARMARQIRASGKKKYSGRTIIEVIRWRADIQTSGAYFKISNNYCPLYARLLAKIEPEFEGFFSQKQLRPHKSLAFQEIA